MDDENSLDKFAETLEIMGYLEQRKNEMIGRMFSSLDEKVSLLETLRSYSKLDLDEIRKSLNLRGLSSANKHMLSSSMEVKIKEMLPNIISRLTDREFKIVKRLIKNDGTLLYNPEIGDELLYLRRLGFIGCFTAPSNCRFVYLPDDTLQLTRDICSNLKVISSIRLNEKLNKLIRGLLYHYGAIDYMKIHKYLDKYLKEPASEYEILNFLVENSRKEYGIKFDGTYLYHDEVFDPEEIEKEQNMRTNLSFLDLTEAQALSSGEKNCSDWNTFDRKLSGFLNDNFNIYSTAVEAYIDELKMDFRSGVSFNEAIGELSENFDLADMSIFRSTIDLVKDVYNNTGQWALKGLSPLEARAFNLAGKSPSQSDDVEGFSFKTGRNQPCPCGSGKKYKHCCLKRNQ